MATTTPPAEEVPSLSVERADGPISAEDEGFGAIPEMELEDDADASWNVDYRILTDDDVRNSNERLCALQADLHSLPKSTDLLGPTVPPALVLRSAADEAGAATTTTTRKCEEGAEDDAVAAEQQRFPGHAAFVAQLSPVRQWSLEAAKRSVAALVDAAAAGHPPPGQRRTTSTTKKAKQGSHRAGANDDDEFEDEDVDAIQSLLARLDQIHQRRTAGRVSKMAALRHDIAPAASACQDSGGSVIHHRRETKVPNDTAKAAAARHQQSQPQPLQQHADVCMSLSPVPLDEIHPSNSSSADGGFRRSGNVPRQAAVVVAPSAASVATALSVVRTSPLVAFSTRGKLQTPLCRREDRESAMAALLKTTSDVVTSAAAHTPRGASWPQRREDGASTAASHDESTARVLEATPTKTPVDHNPGDPCGQGQRDAKAALSPSYFVLCENENTPSVRPRCSGGQDSALPPRPESDDDPPCASRRVDLDAAAQATPRDVPLSVPLFSSHQQLPPLTLNGGSLTLNDDSKRIGDDASASATLGASSVLPRRASPRTGSSSRGEAERPLFESLPFYMSVSTPRAVATLTGDADWRPTRRHDPNMLEPDTKRATLPASKSFTSNVAVSCLAAVELIHHTGGGSGTTPRSSRQDGGDASTLNGGGGSSNGISVEQPHRQASFSPQVRPLLASAAPAAALPLPVPATQPSPRSSVRKLQDAVPMSSQISVSDRAMVVCGLPRAAEQDAPLSPIERQLRSEDEGMAFSDDALLSPNSRRKKSVSFL